MLLTYFRSVLIILFSISAVIRITKSATLQCLPCDATKPNPSAYEEFVFEHQVTKQEAISALNLLNDTFFDAPRGSGCKAINCNSKIMKYCLGSQFLNDHCLCEQGHGQEGLQFVPHTCYVGDKNYGASVGSCYFYLEVKKCCCLQALAKRWKTLSASSRTNGGLLQVLIATLVVAVLKSTFSLC